MLVICNETPYLINLLTFRIHLVKGSFIMLGVCVYESDIKDFHPSKLLLHQVGFFVENPKQCETYLKERPLHNYKKSGLKTQ